MKVKPMMLYKKADNCEHFSPWKVENLGVSKNFRKPRHGNAGPLIISHTYPYAIHDISISKGSHPGRISPWQSPCPREWQSEGPHSHLTNQPTNSLRGDYSIWLVGWMVHYPGSLFHTTNHGSLSQAIFIYSTFFWLCFFILSEASCEHHM